MAKSPQLAGFKLWYSKKRWNKSQHCWNRGKLVNWTFSESFWAVTKKSKSSQVPTCHWIAPSIGVDFCERHGGRLAALRDELLSRLQTSLHLRSATGVPVIYNWLGSLKLVSWWPTCHMMKVIRLYSKILYIDDCGPFVHTYLTYLSIIYPNLTAPGVYINRERNEARMEGLHSADQLLYLQKSPSPWNDHTLLMGKKALTWQLASWYSLVKYWLMYTVHQPNQPCETRFVSSRVWPITHPAYPPTSQNGAPTK